MPQGTMRAIVEAATRRGWKPPARGFWSLEPDAFGIQAEPPTVSVDVHPCVERKLAAIRCHRTQMGSGHPFDQIDRAEATRWLGVEQFHRADGSGAGEPVLERLSVSWASRTN
jgi:LmbE family N-acetylglucosaminyl deacetylase